MNSKAWTKILALVAVAAMIGCGRGGPQAAVPGPIPGAPAPGTPRGDDGGTSNPPVSDRYNWPTGATVDLTIDSLQTLEAYLGRPANLPVGGTITAKMNVDLKDMDASSGEGFGGWIKIAFEEAAESGGTKYNEQKFTTGTTLTSLVYNKFHTAQGQPHFKAFAQDKFGGLLIVIDQVDDLGLMSGSIYFRNFLPATIQQGPLEYCWMIKRGPYDCRDFLVNDSVNMASSVFPTRTQNGTGYYTKLGTFNLMNGQKALNQ